jgi:hypothetical protein
MHYTRCSPALAVVLLMAAHSPAQAQVGRYYVNTPVDTHLVTTTFNGVRSNTWADPAIGDSEIRSRNQTLSLSYNYIASFGDRTGGFGISVPWTSLLSYDVASDQLLLDQNGKGDVALTFDYNLFGAPALSREEFARHTAGDYAGLHFSLTTPTGSYDAGREANIGANRWSLKSTLNYSITRDSGLSWWDFYPSVRLFSDNRDIADTGLLSQNALWGLEAHYSRNVIGPAWLSAGLIGSLGGKTRINGEMLEDSRRDLRLALGAGFPTWPGGAAIVTYHRDLVDRGGASGIRSFMLQLMHKF